MDGETGVGIERGRDGERDRGRDGKKEGWRERDREIPFYCRSIWDPVSAPGTCLWLGGDVFIH